MQTEFPVGASNRLQGQLLRHTARREAAIFLRNGALWVADFVDGHGEIVDAATWVRFNCASDAAGPGRRRMAHESATPLSDELAQRIHALLPPAAAKVVPIATANPTANRSTEQPPRRTR